MALKSKKPKPPRKLTRKEQRKEKRKEKKTRRNDFFSKKKQPEPLVLNPEKMNAHNKQNIKTNTPKEKIKIDPDEDISKSRNQVPTTEQIRKKEKKELKNLESDMRKQRSKQLLEANRDEDKIIRQMEKQLGLKKRKSKSVPKTFSEDGLDFLLEVVDPEYLQNASKQGLETADDDFEEDFALMSGKHTQKKSKLANKTTKAKGESEDEVSDFNSEDDLDSNEEIFEDDLDITGEESDDNLESNDEIPGEESEDSDSDSNISKIVQKQTKQKLGNKKTEIVDEKVSKPAKRKAEGIPKAIKKHKTSNADDSKDEIENLKGNDSDEDFDEEGSIEDGAGSAIKKHKTSNADDSEDEIENLKGNDSDEDFDEEGSIEDGAGSEDENSDEEQQVQKGAVKQYPDGTWEDIYGRLRAKDGAVITEDKAETKYVPPAIREKMNVGSEDKKRLEKLNRLKKQLKGLLNRLAESNMHSIASQIEELYMSNSRNDMNDTLTNLIMDSLVSEVMAPERLLVEHIVLLTILHANVGTEVGAHFLQHVIRKFDEYFKSNHEIENRTLDNIVCIIAQLYNFKIFDAKLIYEVLQKLANNFEEKDVECILHVLRNVGFNMRKDDPLALKKLILDLQTRAANATEEDRKNFRVKFMLDVLLAIKNNNVTKIPNYDVSYPEHLKKVMKGFIRKGNYVTELNISLEDLLKADERGRWWVVGSAWTGNELENDKKTEKAPKSESFSSKLLELARKQRMNTDIRRSIFCIMMSAEDYLDAFEKLLKLGLKNQQEREIINVLLHCCLQEKNYNPYYGHLAQKFCDYDRKYQMTIKYSIWDKLKAMSDHSGSQLSNLAKLLIHLFIEKGLPISTLKIVQFGELDKISLRFMRQVLLGILLHQDLESSLSVFARVSQSEKLKLFRESLRLFIHHFLLRNLKTDKVPQDQKEVIEARAKMVDKVLASKGVKIT